MMHSDFLYVLSSLYSPEPVALRSLNWVSSREVLSIWTLGQYRLECLFLHASAVPTDYVALLHAPPSYSFKSFPLWHRAPLARYCLIVRIDENAVVCAGNRTTEQGEGGIIRICFIFFTNSALQLKIRLSWWRLKTTTGFHLQMWAWPSPDPVLIMCRIMLPLCLRSSNEVSHCSWRSVLHWAPFTALCRSQMPAPQRV